MINTITRFELINHANNKHTLGRLISLYKSEGDFGGIYFSLQDNGKTLKVFISSEEASKDFTPVESANISEVVNQFYEENLIGKFSDEQSKFVKDTLQDFAKHYILL